MSLKLNSSGGGSVTLQEPSTASALTLNLPTASGTVLAGATPSASVVNVVTNKIAVVINGTTYYLLASTSGT